MTKTNDDESKRDESKASGRKKASAKRPAARTSAAKKSPARKKAARKKAAPKKASAKKTRAKKAAAKKAPSVPAGSANGNVIESRPRDRLHKFLASTGAGSRRECEKFIEQERVSVNGKVVTKMGVKVDPTKDVVRLDGEVVKPERKVYYLLNKPAGYICTNADERGRPRVVDLIPRCLQRIYTVGRLDADSRGLILLTNDGTIANIVCHPRYRIEKTYEVHVRGVLDRENVARLEAGVWLAEGKSSPASVRVLSRDDRRQESVAEVVLFEGRNREIRRVFARVGLRVRRLIRTRIGPLELGTLGPGAHRALTPTDLTFVHEAEALYLANQEAWDAELPPEPRRRPRRRRSPPGKRPQRAGGPRGRPGRPSRGGARSGYGGGRSRYAGGYRGGDRYRSDDDRGRGRGGDRDRRPLRRDDTRRARPQPGRGPGGYRPMSDRPSPRRRDQDRDAPPRRRRTYED